MSTLKVDSIQDKAGTGAPSFPNGLVLDPANMSDADATRLGLKQYESVADSITVTPSTGSLARAVFVPYQTQDGTWRCKLNITISSMSGATGTIIITGLTTVNAGLRQTISVGLTANPSSRNINGYIASNTGTISLNTDSTSLSTVALMADIELESKPTWAI